MNNYYTPVQNKFNVFFSIQEVSSLNSETAQDKPSKEEYAVAKWIRNNVPSKKTKFDRNHNVEYFTGTRAVDALLENSPWSKIRFETREQVTKFLDMMLRHKFFHRAKKVVISEEELCKIRGIKKKIKEPKEEKKSNEKEKEDPKENKDLTNKDNEEKSDERKEIKKKSKVSYYPQITFKCRILFFFIDLCFIITGTT